ncbi:MAG: hypothetical protein RIS44_3177 [Pseudomonadota bacterium]|jgi:hypothetical protein
MKFEPLQRLKTECKDLLELVLIPGLAAVMPWPVCFRLFKRISYWPFLYKAASERALAAVKTKMLVDSDVDWLAMRRLVTLVDHADLYLARTRSNRWFGRYMDVSGRWTEPGQAAIFCTFHWGAGMWCLRHAASTGLHCHAMVAPLNGAHFAGRSVLHWYARARTACVANTLGYPTLDVSRTLRPALQALRQTHQLMAAIDVPADEVEATATVNLIGQRAHMPRGLLRVAVEKQLPLVLALTGFDVGTGRRHLRLQHFSGYTDTTLLMQDVFACLDAAIWENSAAWHFWGEAERIFETQTK